MIAMALDIKKADIAILRVLMGSSMAIFLGCDTRKP